MAKQPPEQNLFHHPHAQPHPQLQLPPQFRNPFNLFFEERNSRVNNYNNYKILPYMSANSMQKQGVYHHEPELGCTPKNVPHFFNFPTDYLCESLVMRRPRRTRTTFSPAQIAELEKYFLETRYLNPERLNEVSAKLGLGTAQVKIWFKNRRRRHKISTDRDHLHEDLATESNPRTKVTPQLQSHSMAVSNEAVIPNISLATSTPMDQCIYGDAYNSYYYNNNNGVHIPTYAATAAPIEAATSVTAHCFTQRTQYNGLQHQQYSYQHKTPTNVPVKTLNTDYNYNNPYQMHSGSKPITVTSNLADGPITVRSPQSDIYAPLTPTTDESLSNGGIDVAEDMDHSSPKLQQLFATTHVTDGATDNKVQRRHDNGGKMMDSCTDSYAKYTKMMPSEMHDNNYNCTMDTIMKAYNQRNSSRNSQLAYCFN